MTTVTMSGKCYACCLETSGFMAEHSFPEPMVRRVGKGFQYRWELGAEQLADLVWHVRTLYESSAGWDLSDPGTLDDRAAMRSFLRTHSDVPT